MSDPFAFHRIAVLKVCPLLEEEPWPSPHSFSSLHPPFEHLFFWLFIFIHRRISAPPPVHSLSSPLLPLFMYCNNCCLCFPIRGGGMWLSGLVILVNAVGAIFLFLWGPFFFSSTQAVIFGGFSALQAALAGIAFFGFCSVSEHRTQTSNN